MDKEFNDLIDQFQYWVGNPEKRDEVILKMFVYVYNRLGSSGSDEVVAELDKRLKKLEESRDPFDHDGDGRPGGSKTKKHPFDHDGDGRPGGSKPKSNK